MGEFTVDIFAIDNEGAGRYGQAGKGAFDDECFEAGAPAIPDLFSGPEKK